MRSEGPIHDSVGCESTYIGNSKLILLAAFVQAFICLILPLLSYFYCYLVSEFRRVS
jgi:hypothetical protein